jgi:hypothetical protein
MNSAASSTTLSETEKLVRMPAPTTVRIGHAIDEHAALIGTAAVVAHHQIDQPLDPRPGVGV